MNVDALKELYTLEHDRFTAIPVVHQQAHDSFWINGDIRTLSGEIAGKFTRTVMKVDDNWVAYHEQLSVDNPFRRQGIAFAHYKKAIARYLLLGCRRVEMYAYEYGTFVWPIFGFKLRRENVKGEIITSIHELHQREVGTLFPDLSLDEFQLVQTLSPQERPIGADSFQLIAQRQESGALEMFLDLEDATTLAYLRESGIL